MKAKPKPRPWTPFVEKTLGKPALPTPLLDPTPQPTRIYDNNLYTVLVTIEISGFQSEEYPGGIPMVHLSMRRNDRKVMKSWRDMQRIKNELVGSEFEAVELYPAESRLLDGANQYHLYVLPKGMSWPFGETYRAVLDDDMMREMMLKHGSTEQEVAAFKGKQEPFEYDPASQVGLVGVLGDWWEVDGAR